MRKEDGVVTDFHMVHYTTRAVGQVGLIMVEASAVVPQGRISAQDLGIWNDEQRDGLTKLVTQLKENGAKRPFNLHTQDVKQLLKAIFMLLLRLLLMIK